MKHKTWGELLHSGGPSDSTMKERDTEGGDIEEGDTEGGDTDEGDTEERRKVQRDNVVHTRFLAAAAFVCGMVTSQRGPSILDLRDIIHSDIQSMASLFALGAGGYLVGWVGAGLLMGRLRRSVFLFWVLAGVAVSTAALPWSHQYSAMATLYCISFICVGCLETGSYADIAKRWPGRQGGQIIQLLQLFFVLGGVVSPGLTQFFLAPRNRHHHSVVDNFTSLNGQSDATLPESHWTTAQTSANDSFSQTFMSNGSSLNETESSIVSGNASTNVHIAYIISGSLALLISILFLINFCLRKEQAPPAWKGDPPVPVQQQVRDARLSVLLLMALFFFLMSAVEESIHQFLFTFMVYEAQWSAHMAAWVTTWFWCGMLLVRVAAYLLPDHVGDEAILALSCAILPCTLAGLHASVIFSNNDGAWACVFFMGMSISLIFPVSFTWLHTCLAQRPSAVSAVVMVSTALAGIVNPLVLGSLFHRGHYTGFSFLLMGEAVLGLLVFLLLYVLSRQLTATWHSVSARKSMHVVPGRLEEVHDSDKDAQGSDS